MDEKKKRRKKNRNQGRRVLAVLLALLMVTGSLNLPGALEARAENDSEAVIEESSETASEILAEPTKESQTELQTESQTESQSEMSSDVTEGAEQETQSPKEETVAELVAAAPETTDRVETTAKRTKTITAWHWVAGSEELEIRQDKETGVWGFGMAGVTIDHQADFDTAVSMLPTAITAAVIDPEAETDHEENVELEITWKCDTYVQDADGNWPLSGDYIFTADLPEGYVPAEDQEKLEVMLQLGDAALYDEGNNAGFYNVTGRTSGDDWVYDSGANTLTIQNSGIYTVAGDGSETQERIIVGENLNVTLTVNNVNCVLPGSNKNAAMSISGTSTVTLILEGKNIFSSGFECAGVEFSNAQENCSLTIQGNGELKAQGGEYGAGIGGGNKGSGSNITINGGTVTATGSGIGAGIGGGNKGSGSNITINGGTVTATSGDYGAGIGGGAEASGSNITINGGTVTAMGSGFGAGIGGGIRGSGSNITINEGIVTAISTRFGAGIGGGDSASGSNITINGGTVTARGRSGGGIGSGDGGDTSSDIKIKGGSVKASSDYRQAIGTTPTNGNKNVYPLKMENLSGINSIDVDETSWTRAGNHPDADGNFNDGTFYLYLTGEEHQIVTTNAMYSITWDETNGFQWNAKQAAPSTPTATVTANSIIIDPQTSSFGTDTQYACIEGTAEPSEENGGWKTENQFTGLTPGTLYTCYVRFAGNATYEASDTVSEAFTTYAGSFKVDGGVAGTDWVYDHTADTLTFKKIGTYTVTGDGKATSERIIVGENLNGVTLTVKDVNCVVPSDNENAAMSISGTSTVTLILEGKNTFFSGNEHAGVEFSNAEGNCSLTIQGTGELETQGGIGGAGIGGGDYRSGSNITINSGTVSAAGGDYGAAGIGGGADGRGSNITINGGTVTATSGARGGNGIGGGGIAATSSDIQIKGGSVKASSSNYRPAIGTTPTNGEKNVYPLKIETLSGVDSIAVDGKSWTRNGNHPNGDGAFYLYLTGEDHKIEASNVKYLATWNSDANDFTLKVVQDDPSTPTAMVTSSSITIDEQTSSVGTGTQYACKKDGELPSESDWQLSNKFEDLTANVEYTCYVRFEGTDTYAVSNVASAAFTTYAGSLNVDGGIEGDDWVYDHTADTLTIKKIGAYTITGDGKATSERIIVGENLNEVTLTVKDVNCVVPRDNENAAMSISGTSTVTLILEGKNIFSSGFECAGVEFSNAQADCSLTIQGNGELKAQGGNGGAGIGGGNYGRGSNIIIRGGTVTATGGNDAAGIGGGSNGRGSNITINGGTVTATGGNGGAGIGGGGFASGSNITINGGIVTASGGFDGGAGIGGGKKYSGSSITINGGTVTAASKSYGAGIGGGEFAAVAYSDIKITGGSVKASSASGQAIGTTPTNGTDDVYLVELDNLSGIDSLSGIDCVTVDGTDYKRNGNHPDDNGDFKDSAFYLYLTGKNHKLEISNIKYLAKWNVDTKGFIVKPLAPTPALTTDSIQTTANSITVTALENQAVYGTAEYSLNGTDWDSSNKFIDLHSKNHGKSYTVYARYRENEVYAGSDIGTLENVTTSEANYTISIPASPIEADGTSKAELKPSDDFDLGVGGYVDIQAKESDSFKNGILTLTYTDAASGVSSIKSQMRVGDQPISDLSQNIASFKARDDASVEIKFEKPTQTDIRAGQYSGIVTFTMTYVETE